VKVASISCSCSAYTVYAIPFANSFQCIDRKFFMDRLPISRPKNQVIRAVPVVEPSKSQDKPPHRCCRLQAVLTSVHISWRCQANLCKVCFKSPCQEHLVDVYHVRSFGRLERETNFAEALTLFKRTAITWYRDAVSPLLAISVISCAFIPGQGLAPDIMKFRTCPKEKTSAEV